MSLPINEKYDPTKRIVGGVYAEDPTPASSGENVALSVDDIGRMNLACTPFDPQAGSGQALAFSAVAARSTVLTIGARYWLWATEAAWIAVGGDSITATSSDFPIPPGAVTEYTPTTGRDYVSAVRITASSGTLYIGRSA